MRGLNLALRPLREADWLNAQRARAWCITFAVMVTVAIGIFIATSRGGIDITGKPLGTDFISFWVASEFALSGHAASAYDPAIHEAAEAALFPLAAPAYTAFFYPPTFLLICLPLAALPYLVALPLWLISFFLLLCAGLRRILPQRWAILPILFLPGAISNAGHGQNAFLTASCFVWSMVLARSRPFCAGLCLGLLVFKPHMLLAAPVALLAGRRWAIIAGGVTSGIALCFLSWVVLGTDAWLGFLHISPLARATLEQGFVEYSKLQSLFSAVRLLDGSVALAYGLQAILAVAVCAILLRTAIRRADPQAEIAIFIVSTLLCTPFVLDYDLVCLAPVIAWVVSQAARSGWKPWEKIVLLAAYILPLVARLLAMEFSLPVAPIVMMALLLVVARRTEAIDPGNWTHGPG